MMNDSRPSLFVAPIFAKVFTVVLAVAVAGIGVAIIWLQGTIAARDMAGTLISAVIFAYWLHMIVIARQDSSATRDYREPVEKETPATLLNLSANINLDIARCI